MKQFVALARVSSREQEREGFSLKYRKRPCGGMPRRPTVKSPKSSALPRRPARATNARRSASDRLRQEERRALDGLLFYKVDRAARNLFDYVELERLESEYGLPFISVSQPTENTPAGQMMRRMLANMATFYTEQQSVDVREGWPAGCRKAGSSRGPYGYRNVRKDGRGIVEIDPESGRQRETDLRPLRL